MPRVAVCVLTLAALVAGCGGSPSGGPSSKSAYATKLRRAGQALSDGLSATSLIASQPKPPSSIASEAKRARAALSITAIELTNANPPSDAKLDNEKVVTGLRFVRDEIYEYAKAAEVRDWRSINRLNQAEARSRPLDAAVGALLDLRKKGYKVGALLQGGTVAFTGRSSTSASVCSSASGTVTAPSVIGQSEQEAVRHLREAGLDATVFPQIKPNPRVPEGVVVHESPLHFPVCAGTPIWIIVSIGKT